MVAAINVTLRQMRAFATVARQSSFRQAAEMLNLSQSALSTAILQMERELKVTLFDRTTRRVDLTDIGRGFLTTVERILTDVDLGIADVRAEGQGQRGRVVVSSILSVASQVLPMVIVAFKEKYPNIKITVLDHTVTAVHRSLLTNEADFGICGQSDLDPELDCKFVAPDRYQAIAPLGHALAKLKSVRWADVVGYPMVAMTRGTQIRDQIESVLQSRDLAINAVCEMSQPLSIEAMVQARLGVSILPKSSLSPGNRRIWCRPLTDPVLDRRLVTIWRKGRSLSPAAETFRAEVERYMIDRLG